MWGSRRRGVACGAELAWAELACWGAAGRMTAKPPPWHWAPGSLVCRPAESRRALRWQESGPSCRLDTTPSWPRRCCCWRAARPARRSCRRRIRCAWSGAPARGAGWRIGPSPARSRPPEPSPDPRTAPALPQAVQELLELQRASRTGVIELDARLFEKYVVGKSRPYSLFVVADAKHLRSKGKLQLGALLRDYSAVARAFAAEHAGKPTEGRAFFVSVEYNAARDVMSRCEAPGIPAGAAVSGGDGSGALRPASPLRPGARKPPGCPTPPHPPHTPAGWASTRCRS